MGSFGRGPRSRTGRSARPTDSVCKNVDWTELTLNPLDHVVNFILVHQIGLQCQRTLTHPLYFLGQCFHLTVLDHSIANGYIRPGLGERQRYRATHSFPCSGNEGQLAFQREG
jgi:hypothetical protein